MGWLGDTMIMELHEAILKACAGHAGPLVSVASTSGACSFKRMSYKQELPSAILFSVPEICWTLKLTLYNMQHKNIITVPRPWPQEIWCYLWPRYQLLLGYHSWTVVSGAAMRYPMCVLLWQLHTIPTMWGSFCDVQVTTDPVAICLTSMQPILHFQKLL